MTNVSGSMSSPNDSSPISDEPKHQGLGALTLGALGIVFGDIGTSPLYAIKETFGGHHPLPIDRLHVLGVLSLVFWTITLVVSIKYVTITMRADNKGEGGSLALVALLERAIGGTPLAGKVALLGIVAAALFYGDCMITPAISVLSAVEGLNVAAPQLETFIVPITVAILVALFLIQRHGSSTIGTLFGPIIILWFGALAAFGIAAIAKMPSVLWALSPHYAAVFVFSDGWTAFLAFGSVFLAVTGAEALFADMGHFGRTPIRIGWYLVVLPGLLLNYFGQGALLLTDPAAIDNPFFRLVPAQLGIAMVVLAAMATVIASQAVISGAFSLTQQAVHFGFLPRLRTIFTSDQRGQIYLPFVNWALLAAVLALVIGFGNSSNLAAAYGIAVSGTMVLTTVLMAMVAAYCWNWSRRRIVVVFGGLLLIDAAFLGANATKIPYGGWVPLAIALCIYVLLTTWRAGRKLLNKIEADNEVTLKDLLPTLGAGVAHVPGTAIFLTSKSDGLPAALLHNLKHNKVLHERNILLTVEIDDSPRVPEGDRIEAQDLGDGFRRLVLHFGYRDVMDIPRTLALGTEAELGFFYLPMEVSYFISRETLIAATGQTMGLWRKRLFLWMWRTAVSTMEFFRLPTNRVVELGSQSKI